ncbi:MAG: McrC family protein [Candidatus Heimdallarchaeaceae archaeon]
MVILVRKKFCEWDEQIIKDVSLSEDDRVFLNNIRAKIEVLELRKGLQVTTKNWIGVIKLSSFILEIRPKFDEGFEYLPHLINYTNNKYKIHKSKKRFQIEKNDNLLELIIKMFIFELQNTLLKGLKKDYNEKNEDILTIRGRVNFTRQIQQNLNLPLPIACIYDEYDYNNIENKIILLTLDFLSTIRSHCSLNKEIKNYQQFFQQICSIEDFNKDFSIFYQLRYHRQNLHYQELHNLCRFILFGHGIDNIYVNGNQSVFCFLLDMNYLFEEFIYRLLSDFSNKSIRIYKQKSKDNAILYKGEKYHSIRPDILVCDQNNNIIELIDVKYKRYDGYDTKINPADIYQLYFYSKAFVTSKQGYSHCKIIFFIDKGDVDDFELMLNSDGENYSKLKAIGVDIKDIIIKIIETDEQYLKEIVRKIIF